MRKRKSIHRMFYVVISVFYMFTHCFADSPLDKKQSEKPMVLIICSYNNHEWYEFNLNSALNQEYSNYRIIYINDCSNDGTGQDVEEYINEKCDSYRVINFDDTQSGDITDCVDKFVHEMNADRSFFTLVNNVNRCGALENLYRAINSCKDHEIIVTLDGDDWLYHNQVLRQLNKIYSAGRVWLTHGRLIEYPNGHATWCEPIPKIAIKQNTFRKYKCASHLRTFYAWLFKKIKLEDLLWNGQFFPMTWDMAIMFPMCEMAGERHEFISDINYVYNVANEINDNKVDQQLQRDLDVLIRSMPPYKRLKR